MPGLFARALVNSGQFLGGDINNIEHYIVPVMWIIVVWYTGITVFMFCWLCIPVKSVSNEAHYFLVYLFQFLYMFRATMCPSSGEFTVSMQYWYFSLCMGGCLVCWLGWALISQICFWNKTLHVSDSSSVHHEFSLYTQQWYMPYRFADSLLASCQQEISAHPNQQTRQPPIQSEKYQYCIDTVSSPDRGDIVGQKHVEKMK